MPVRTYASNRYQLKLWKEPKKNTAVVLSGYLILNTRQVHPVRVFHFEVEDEDEMKIMGDVLNKSGDDVGEILLPADWKEQDEPVATIKLGLTRQALAKCRLRKRAKKRPVKEPYMYGTIQPINFGTALDRERNV